jgi:hypothetical protein
MFQKVLQFKDVISLDCNKKNIIIINDKVPILFIWHIFKIIINSISPIVNACVLN